MAKEHTAQISDFVRAQSARVLQQLKIALPNNAALATATDQDVKISPLGTQGASKSTFEVRVKNDHFILSVYTPDCTVKKGAQRASIKTQRALEDAWRGAGIPVPNMLGSEFNLAFGTKEYACELTEFCHGYQVKELKDLTKTEIDDMAHWLVKSHTLAVAFKPDDAQAPPEITYRGLPYGFVHNDINPGNIIFKSDKTGVAGFIDFERARYRSLVYDLGRVAGSFLDVSCTPEQKFTIHITPAYKEFMKSYMGERPLNNREMAALETSAMYGVWRQCLTVNGEKLSEQYKDTSPPKRTLGEKLRLRADIAQATLGFRSEMHNFMRELKQEAAQGKSGVQR